MGRLGIVAIGRNEGERLRRCLTSVAGRADVVVYVDSGSTDGSVALARSLGVVVVELDRSRPFTAAWARNEGIAALLQSDPDLSYIQMVDGDCEVVPGWLETARRVLDDDPSLGVVGGRCRERDARRTIYNRLADLEWDTPIGPARSCGGNAMVRVEAFRRAGGFDPALIAGEEPELCVRIRRAGWTVRRIDAEMVLHDIAMTRFAQWWRRAVRAGHAFAEGSALHGAPPERHYVKETRSIVVWGIVVPLAVVMLAWPTRGLSLVLLLGYVLILARAYRYYRSARGWPPSDALLYAGAAVLAKFPQAVGLLLYRRRRWSGARGTLIEYKEVDPAPAAEA